MSERIEPITAESARSAKIALIRAMSPPPDGPARNGYAAELIARNAAVGAARKEPAMTNPDRTLAAELFRAVTMTVDTADAVQDWIEARYQLTPHPTPTDPDTAAFDRMVERKRQQSTRDQIEAERARRTAVGDAFTSVLLGTNIQDVVGQSKGSVGDRFIRRLRELGYDVVKIEGGE